MNFCARRQYRPEKLRVRAIGRWKDYFNQSLKERICELQRRTAGNDGDKNLTLLLAYNGDDELSEAVTKFHRTEPLTKIATWERVKNWSWSRFLPDVDIMIRTGSEPHFSGSALLCKWQTPNFISANVLA